MHLHVKHSLFFLFLIILAIVLGLFLIRTPIPATHSTPENLTNIYENTVNGYSVHYPDGYTPNSRYVYMELGPGKFIEGVKFTIASSTILGTNLGGDSYVSVERIATTTLCTPSLFLEDQGREPQTITDGGIKYLAASSTGAGAGNRYEETIYVLPGTNPCTAVRYFIHYSVFENYPPGTVHEFNHSDIINEFDAIRRTLLVAH